MADQDFTAIPPKLVVGVTSIEYTIVDVDTIDDDDSMSYTAQLKYDDGTYASVTGNVVPHLTAMELTGLQNLIARLRSKAESAWGSL